MCGIPSVQGAMNGTHISIVKPQGAFVEDCYYHKIGVNIMAQFVIDCNKIFVGHVDNVNDLRVLCKCILYKNVQDHGLFVL